MSLQNGIFITETGAKPIGPYVSGRRVGNLMFFSGMIGINKELALSPDFSEQTKQAFENIASFITEIGASLSNIIKITIYLTDMNHYKEMNTIMSQYFPDPQSCPARTAIGVSSLPRHAQIEIDAIVDLSQQ